MATKKTAITVLLLTAAVKTTLNLNVKISILLIKYCLDVSQPLHILRLKALLPFLVLLPFRQHLINIDLGLIKHLQIEFFVKSYEKLMYVAKRSLHG